MTLQIIKTDSKIIDIENQVTTLTFVDQYDYTQFDLTIKKNKDNDLLARATTPQDRPLMTIQYNEHSSVEFEHAVNEWIHSQFEKGYHVHKINTMRNEE